MAEPGSVAFQFNRKGVVTIEADEDTDTQLLTVLDAGAEDAVVEEDEMIVYTEMKDLHTVRKALADADMKIKDAGLQYIPSNTVQIDSQETEDKLFKLLDALDELDDVTSVYHNAITD